MKFVAFVSLFSAASAFVAPKAAFRSPSMALGAFDQEQYIAESKEMRLKHLEEQAMFALKISCENFDNAGKHVVLVFYFSSIFCRAHTHTHVSHTPFFVVCLNSSIDPSFIS